MQKKYWVLPAQLAIPSSSISSRNLALTFFCSILPLLRKLWMKIAFKHFKRATWNLKSWLNDRILSQAIKKHQRRDHFLLPIDFAACSSPQQYCQVGDSWYLGLALSVRIRSKALTGSGLWMFKVVQQKMPKNMDSRSEMRMKIGFVEKTQ